MENEVYERTIARLRASNIRLTPQRDAIIRFMINSTAHPTAEAIFKALHPEYPRLSVATVYNTLRLLASEGLIEEMSVGDTATHFDFALTPHYHAVCKRCGRIVDFVAPQASNVKNAAQARTGYLIEDLQLEVYGYCPSCQAIMRNEQRETLD